MLINTTRRPDDIVFECVRLKGLNKQGVIKPDANGCYTQIIGGLNAYNSAGDFYEYDAAVEFFQRQSSFQRKIARGVLRAEYGHPTIEPGMSMEHFKQRVLKIVEKEICGTWAAIWLSKESLSDDQGRPFIPIMGSIRPSGPYGEPLRRGFESPGEQVCFSIRSFTQDTPMRGGFGMRKRLKEIITFDYVNEPGIYSAEKLLSPTMESLEEIRMDASSIVKAIDTNFEVSREVSLESSNDYSDLRDKLLLILDKETPKPTSVFYKW